MDRKSFIEGLGRATRGGCYGLAELTIVSKELFGDENEHNLTFYFFDGLAYCPNYEGKKYMIKDMPRVDYFKEYKDEAQSIIDEFKLKSEKDITPQMISVFYGNVTCEGDANEEDLNIDYDEEERLYKPSAPTLRSKVRNLLTS